MPDAVALWTSLGCPFESARARIRSTDASDLAEALAELDRLGASPAAREARAGLRGLGAPVPRGPRSSTRANPADLTTRELEVLRLLVEGLRNPDIAARLVLSTRTVDHHVAAILRKLGCRTRGEAGVAAARLGIGKDR